MRLIDDNGGAGRVLRAAGARHPPINPLEAGLNHALLHQVVAEVEQRDNADLDAFAVALVAVVA